MVSIGPRVGGAHVDITGKHNVKSFDTVGKRIQQQLAAVGERNKRVYQRFGADAVAVWRTALGSIVASAPLIGAATSALSGGITMIAGAFAAAAKSAASLTTVIGSLAVAVGTGVVAFEGFGAAITAANTEALEKALANLTPSARESALAVRSLRDEAHELRMTVQETFFTGLSEPIRDLATTLLPVATAGMDKMAVALNGLAKDMLGYVNSSAGLDQISGVLNNSASIFDRLSNAVVPFLDGTLRLFNALAPSGERLADTITRIAQQFQQWTQAEGFAGRVDQQMQQAEKTAGLLFEVIGNLTGAIRNIFQATNPATNEFLTILTNVTQKFQDWTASVGGQNTIAEWATSAVTVMSQFGRTASAAFELIAELADPRIITSFLTTLENAFTTLSALPLDRIVSGFADIAEALEPISGKIVAVIIAGAGLQVLFGNMIAQVGGAVLAYTRFTGGAGKLKAFFTTLRTGVSSASGLSKVTAAFRGLSGVLSAGLRFAGFAGLAIWIATIIAKSDSLKAKFGEVFGAIKGLITPIKGAFDEISAALGNLTGSGGFQAISAFFEKMIGLAITFFLDGLILGFQGLGKVISGIGSIIGGFINVIAGLLSLDFGMMWDGIKQMFSGLGPLLAGVIQMFIGFFAPAKFLGLGARALTGLLNGIRSVLPAITGGIRFFVVTFMQIIRELPLRLLPLGLRALQSLGRGITQGIPIVIKFVGRMLALILDVLTLLPRHLLKLGLRAIKSLGNAIRSATPGVLATAGRILTGIMNALRALPSRLLSLGRSAISGLMGAIRAGISMARSAASSIASAAVNALSSLGSRLASRGRSAISSLLSAIRSGISRARSAASSIVSAAVSALSSFPGRLRSAGLRAIQALAGGITAGLSAVRSAVGKITSAIGRFFPGSPIKEGPLKSWNNGGAGIRLMDAFASGVTSSLPDLQRASARVAAAVGSSFSGMNALGSLPPIGVSPRMASAVGASAAVSSSRGGDMINIAVNLDVRDLEQIRTVEEFMQMLNASRVQSRTTLRSGTVTN